MHPNHICPVCGEPTIGSCRCPRSDSECKNGHKWHTCIKHHTKVLGHSDHSIPGTGCTCLTSSLQVLKTNNKLTVAEQAILELLDGQSVQDIVGGTGMSVERAQEIKDLYYEILKKSEA